LKILVVEDEPIVADPLLSQLRETGYDKVELATLQLYVLNEFTTNNSATEPILKCYMHPKEDHFFIKASNNANEKVLIYNIPRVETTVSPIGKKYQIQNFEQ